MESIDLISESSSEFRLSAGVVESGYHDYEPMESHGMTQPGRVAGYGRVWFVKSLSEGCRDVGECRQTLVKEYEILLGLRGGPVPEVVALCEIEGAGLSIVMENVAGEHLDKYMAKASRRQRRIVLQKLVGAVAYIHSKGVTHLDLKPENVIVGGAYDSPEVYLIDFNLSDSSVFIYNKVVGGNKRYAAPEQFESGYVADMRADVWSLGMLLKEYGAGLGWRSIARASLQKNPERRPKDATALIAMRRDRKKVRYGIAVCLAVAVLAAGGFLLFRSENVMPQQTPESAVRESGEAVPLFDLRAENPTEDVSPATVAGSADENVSAEAKQTDKATEYDLIHDRLIAQAKREIAEIMELMREIAADNSLTPSERRYKLATKTGKMMVVDVPQHLIDGRNTIPETERSRHPLEWCTIGDEDLKEANKSYQKLYSELDTKLEAEIRAAQEASK